MIQGVDRSHNNSPIKLVDLVAKGIKFIWFKASQGNGFKDPTFQDSWHEAIATSGLIRGAYHFFDPRYDGVAQADLFLSCGVVFTNTGCLPPCVDVEDLVGRDEATTNEANKWVADNWQLAVSRLQAFLGHVKQNTGRDCVIYSYNNYMREYLHGTPFADNPMWVSSLQATCPSRYDTGKMPEFWQFTYNWNGGDMDGNYFTGTEDQLNNLANIV